MAYLRGRPPTWRTVLACFHVQQAAVFSCSPHGLGSLFDVMGVTFEVMWEVLGVIWCTFGIILGSSWNDFGVILESL